MTIVISGLTGSGKTTLSGVLSRMLGTTPARTSDFLIARLNEARDKDSRLHAWRYRSTGLLTDEELSAGLASDREHLGRVQPGSKEVHESMALPLLLTQAAGLCRVFLDTSENIRFKRVARRHGIGLETARQLGARKDAQTCLYIQWVYGLAVGSQAHLDYYDVMVHQHRNGVTDITVPAVVPDELPLLKEAIDAIPTIWRKQ